MDNKISFLTNRLSMVENRFWTGYCFYWPS